MVEIDGHVLTGVGVGHGDRRAGEMRVPDSVAEQHGIANVVRPVGPIGVLVDQGLQDDARSFEGIGGNVGVVELQVFEERGVTDIGHGVARGLLVPLSVDEEIRAFVSIGSQKNRTFLNRNRRSRSRRTTLVDSDLEIAVFQHGDRILREESAVDDGHEKEKHRSTVLNGVLGVGDVSIMLFVHNRIVHSAFEHHFDVFDATSALADLRDLLSFVSKLFVG